MKKSYNNVRKDIRNQFSSNKTNYKLTLCNLPIDYDFEIIKKKTKNPGMMVQLNAFKIR